MKEYSQDSEDSDVFLTKFQNLKTEAKIDDVFARKILLKNADGGLVEQSPIQKGKLVFEALVVDLRRLDHAKYTSSLLGSKVKEVPYSGLRGRPSKCFLCRAQWYLARDCNTAPREQSHSEVLVKECKLAIITTLRHPSFAKELKDLKKVVAKLVKQLEKVTKTIKEVKATMLKTPVTERKRPQRRPLDVKLLETDAHKVYSRLH